MLLRERYVSVAQLVEQRSPKPWVVGSSPATFARQLNMEQEEDPRLFQDNCGCNEVAGGLFLFLGGGEGDCKKANGKGDRA